MNQCLLIMLTNAAKPKNSSPEVRLSIPRCSSHSWQPCDEMRRIILVCSSQQFAYSPICLSVHNIPPKISISTCQVTSDIASLPTTMSTGWEWPAWFDITFHWHSINCESLHHSKIYPFYQHLPFPLTVHMLSLHWHHHFSPLWHWKTAIFIHPNFFFYNSQTP
jgi:hypothetical protein